MLVGTVAALCFSLEAAFIKWLINLHVEAEESA